MTTVPNNKLQEVRAHLRAGHKSRYGLVRDLMEYGMGEDEATDYIDHLASEVFDVPTADERQVIREQHIHRENVGGYRNQMIGGGIILFVSLAISLSGFTLGLVSIFGVIIGLVLVLYALRIRLLSH